MMISIWNVAQLENYKQAHLRSMMEEYGNAVSAEVDIADVPDNVDIPR